jgi:O-antigen/teichoic acid export membrane protein
MRRVAEAMGRRIASGAVLGGVNLGLAAVVTLVTTPLYLGALKESGFGLNATLVAVFAMLNLLSLGAQEATLYFAARDLSEAYVRVLAKWHATAAALGALILGGGGFFGLGAWLGLKDTELGQFQEALLPAALLWAAQFFCQWLWILSRARLRFTLQAGHQALMSVLVPLFAIAALRAVGGLNAFLWAQALAWVLGCAILSPLLLRAPSGFKASGSEWGQVAAYSRWTFLFYAGFVALQSADRFFVVPLGAAAVAAYAIASSIFQRGVSALGLLPSLLMPAISRLSDDSEHDRALRAYGLSLRFSAILALAFFLPLAALGKEFLAAWLDAKSPGISGRAYGALLLFCAAGFFAGMSAVVHAVLLGQGRARLVGLTALLGAALGLLAAWLGVRRLGLEGAALAALVGYGFLYVARVLISERMIFHRSLIQIALEHALLLACAMAAFMGLRSLGAMALQGGGIVFQLAGLALSALALLALGLLADAWLAKRKGRLSVVGTLLGILKLGR